VAAALLVEWPAPQARAAADRVAPSSDSLMLVVYVWLESLKMIAAQCRAGRALLNVTVEELARLAVVATDTLVRFENGAELKPRTVDAIREALEGAGCEFVDENGGGPGVRLKRPTR
jgi:hypothetical protein